MKRIIAGILILAALLLGACSHGTANDIPETDTSSVPNPVAKSSADEILRLYGINFSLPGESTDISYSIINQNTAQVQFSFNGIYCTGRAAREDGLTDISGMYFQWENSSGCIIGGTTGQINYNQGGVGICLWYDSKNGMAWSLSVSNNASEKLLISLSKILYGPSSTDVSGLIDIINSAVAEISLSEDPESTAVAYAARLLDWYTISDIGDSSITQAVNSNFMSMTPTDQQALAQYLDIIYDQLDTVCSIGGHNAIKSADYTSTQYPYDRQKADKLFELMYNACGITPDTAGDIQYLGTECKFDLDLDGAAETLKLIPLGTNGEFDIYELSVNGITVRGYGYGVVGDIMAVNFNGFGYYIAVFDPGFESPSTAFYSWKNGQLTSAGSVPGDIREMELDKGCLSASFRAFVLDEDYFSGIWGIDMGQISLRFQTCYFLIESREYRLVSPLTVYESPDTSSASRTLEPQRVIYEGANLDGWAMITDEENNVCWLQASAQTITELDLPVEEVLK